MKHKICKLFGDCNIKLIQTKSIGEGLNSTSGVPTKTSGEWILKSNLKFIKYKLDPPVEKSPSFWKKCSITNIEFFNCKLYITALTEIIVGEHAGEKATIYLMVENFLVGLYIYTRHTINMTKILAWVGGILSTILTIKEIFN